MLAPGASALATLSRRGRDLLAHSKTPAYLTEHAARTVAGTPAALAHDGYVPLCVAENRLVWDLLAPRARAARDVPASAFGYDVMTGALDFRRALSQTLDTWFLGRRFPPEQIAVLAGAGSVLELTFHALADAGDSVLVPTPSYAGFWLALETRNELAIVPVDCHSSDGFRLTPALLEKAAARADRPIRALLLASPGNPLGNVYSAEDLEAILDWAATRDLHVVCDEIYALSIFGPRPFTSVARLRPALGERLHIVWAFSKDFAASGLRCGVLVSENADLLRAVDALAYWACCSGDTQALLHSMIADAPFVAGYVMEMRRRLAAAYANATQELAAAGIPFLPAQAGFFFLVDLRRYLDQPTAAGEERLWRRLLDEANVGLTPGGACRIAEPGFFRLCFAAAEPARVTAAVRRIARVLHA